MERLWRELFQIFPAAALVARKKKYEKVISFLTSYLIPECPNHAQFRSIHFLGSLKITYAFKD